jgi:hypothetical protein
MPIMSFSNFSSPTEAGSCKKVAGTPVTDTRRWRELSLSDERSRKFERFEDQSVGSVAEQYGGIGIA